MPHAAAAPGSPVRRAQIAISLDLEMSRQYPRRDMLEWDYEKGNLDAATKDYAVEAARRVRQLGGRVHFFCVGRVLEQPNVDWLKAIAEAGHPIGNHTYDHVNMLATRAADVQFRFQRSPWLIAGRSIPDVLRENVRLTTLALKERVGVDNVGFRTPGGFASGLAARADVQQLLLDQGFSWVSSKYPAHAMGTEATEPTEEIFRSIVEAQAAAQPFRYPSGLIEIPMSPVSDVNAFRSSRWKLDWYLEAVRRAVAHIVETGGVFDFLAHPSCLVVEDPEFKIVELIGNLVKAAGDRAEFATLDQVASRLTNP